MKRITVFIACVLLLLAGCTPLEQQAYQTVVAGNAFLKSMKAAHPECQIVTTTTVCGTLIRATAAKDTLIDAVEVYCAGPDFDNGGKCNAPMKGTPAAAQAFAKLSAALAGYNQLQADLKAATKGGAK